MSNFVRQRGFLDPNRLLHAPTTTYSGVPRYNAQDPASLQMSNTNLMGEMNPNELSSNTQVLWGTNINTNSLSARLREFLTTFTPAYDDDQHNMNE